ncbi:MAG: 3-oxoacid CoA-transferase subunit A [Alphaproteobacteria bacterium]|nr:3-oxoacid CoA-transferase subunit A [Alphaproteobacteria bacterium]
MKQKKAKSLDEAIDHVSDGDTILVGGFGVAGVPEILIDGICGRGLKDLTIVSNNAGTRRTGIARLLEEGCVRKIICSFPRSVESFVFKELYDAGKIELEVVPQGTMAERMRAAGAGLGGFLTPTGLGSELAAGKPVHEVDGKEYVLEKPLRADIALIKALKVDPYGNLIFRKAARNFNPVMATAAAFTIVEAAEEVGVGDLDPEVIITPGVFVDCYHITGWYEPANMGPMEASS